MADEFKCDSRLVFGDVGRTHLLGGAVEVIKLDTNDLANISFILA
jgi:hypothetical protein